MKPEEIHRIDPMERMSLLQGRVRSEWPSAAACWFAWYSQIHDDAYLDFLQQNIPGNTIERHNDECYGMLDAPHDMRISPNICLALPRLAWMMQQGAITAFSSRGSIHEMPLVTLGCMHTIKSYHDHQVENGIPVVPPMKAMDRCFVLSEWSSWVRLAVAHGANHTDVKKTSDRMDAFSYPSSCHQDPSMRSWMQRQGGMAIYGVMRHLPDAIQHDNDDGDRYGRATSVCLQLIRDMRKHDCDLHPDEAALITMHALKHINMFPQHSHHALHLVQVIQDT
jgi:hypothetical protein